MKTVFADTGYWIALINPDDALHIRAHQLTKQFLPFNIITTELVLNELMNAFSRKNAQLKQAAIQLIHSLLDDPTVEVIPPSLSTYLPKHSRFTVRGLTKHGVTLIAPPSALWKTNRLWMP